MDISFLLFSSMLRPTEQYLSREIRDKPKAAKSNLKSTISKAISKKKGLFRKKAVKESSLDSEIEAAITNVKNLGEGAVINELLIKEITKASESRNTYETQEEETSNELKASFKSLYQTFVSYAKGTHTKTYKTIKTGTKQIIEGPVRMTLAKFIKVFEYIQAAINPQWNMPTLSKMDYDTLSPAVTNHIIINKEDINYDPEYSIKV